MTVDVVRSYFLDNNHWSEILRLGLGGGDECGGYKLNYAHIKDTSWTLYVEITMKKILWRIPDAPVAVNTDI